MTVFFWDKRRETYLRQDDVETVEMTWSKGRNGRPTKFWTCTFADGKTKTLQCSHYDINKVVNA